jgi:hypothetical protein
MKRILALAMLLTLSGSAFPCVQAWDGFSTLRSDEFKGRITFRGKPLLNAQLELHKFLLDDADSKSSVPVRARRIKSAPEVLRTASTDTQGLFTFGKLPPGKYVVRMTKPSHETITIDLIAPDEYSQDARVWIRGYADWCTDVIIEPTDSSIAATN